MKQRKNVFPLGVTGSLWGEIHLHYCYLCDLAQASSLFLPHMSDDIENTYLTRSVWGFHKIKYLRFCALNQMAPHHCWFTDLPIKGPSYNKLFGSYCYVYHKRQSRMNNAYELGESVILNMCFSNLQLLGQDKEMNFCIWLFSLPSDNSLKLKQCF